MFGLSYREQRWKAEQKAVETALDFALKAKKISVDTQLRAELQDYKIKCARLEEELKSIREVKNV